MRGNHIVKRKRTSADRFIDALLAANPELASLRDGTFAASSVEAAEAAVWLMGRRGFPAPSRMDHAELLRAQSGDLRLAVPEDIALWSRWRSCRHVYEYDADLAEALKASDSPDSMPLAALSMLPYPIQYVQAPIRSWSPSGAEFDHPGFFAWADTQRDARGGVHDVLLVFLVRREEGLPCVRLSLDLSCATVGEAVDDLVDADAALYGRLAGGPGGFDAASARARARETAGDALSLLLYLVSDAGDQEVSYRPSGGGGPKRLSPSTIHSVGTRAGAALRAAKVRYVGGGHAPTGRTVSAHVRAGHWHCHWHGAAGSPERRLVPHWQAPILVNPGGRDDHDTIVHRAGS